MSSYAVWLVALVVHCPPIYTYRSVLTDAVTPIIDLGVASAGPSEHRNIYCAELLDSFLNGNVDGIIDDLIALDTAMRLKGEENGN